MVRKQLPRSLRYPSMPVVPHTAACRARSRAECPAFPNCTHTHQCTCPSDTKKPGAPME